ncbi:MAG: sigma-70 family RNA polymerase sigma factor [Burkholderiaceae bacterium]|nr:sigma-70 family RNA polymerase sigma factor [Burkholderiaceae bacterium]
MNNTTETTRQDFLYKQVVSDFGGEIARFVTGYEKNIAKRQELLQEAHLALWRSMAGFKEQCSLRTWTYRVIHNVGVTHIQRNIRSVERSCVEIEEAQHQIDEHADITVTDRRLDLERVLNVIHSLEALDREIMLLYLENLDAKSISEITGLSTRNIATKIHRIKSILAIQLGYRSTAT